MSTETVMPILKGAGWGGRILTYLTGLCCNCTVGHVVLLAYGQSGVQ